jgi:hypothetical protein
MAEMIEAAKTGRARCRVCRQPIEKGALRFGEEQPNAFGEGLQWVWNHLACAAKKKPVLVRTALASFEGEVPARDELEAVLAEADKTASVFPYAEHASTGRSKCQHCRETIEKGELRVATEREVEPGAIGRGGAAYHHPKCAGEALEREDLLEAVRRNSRGLSDADLAELEQHLA